MPEAENYDVIYIKYGLVTLNKNLFDRGSFYASLFQSKIRLSGMYKLREEVVFQDSDWFTVILCGLVKLPIIGYLTHYPHVQFKITQYTCKLKIYFTIAASAL